MKHYNHKCVVGHWTKVRARSRYDYYTELQRFESNGRFYFCSDGCIYFERQEDATWFYLTHPA